MKNLRWKRQSIIVDDLGERISAGDVGTFDDVKAMAFHRLDYGDLVEPPAEEGEPEEVEDDTD